MPADRGGGLGGPCRFAQYPPLTFAMVPEGLIAGLVARRVGRNGWAVMVALCRKLYEDGRLGCSSASEIASSSGLTAYQIARGMTELRDKGVIEPVTVKLPDGRRRPDKSANGHVAQYRITREVWACVDLAPETGKAPVQKTKP